MNFLRKNTIKMWNLAILFSFVCAPCMAPDVWAQEKLVEILEITPLESSGSEAIIVPTQFDGKGRIDRLDGMELVVGDKLRKLSPHAVFYTQKGKIITRNQLYTGDMIGYVQNQTGELYKVYKLEQ